jgi:hypothetical protein
MLPSFSKSTALSSRFAGNPLALGPAQVRWPGPELDDLDADALTDLLINQRLKLSEAASRLGWSLDHVRLFLRRQPLLVRSYAGHNDRNPC